MTFDEHKIIDEHGGKCKTRDGADAIIYAAYPGQEYPIHGAILDGGIWRTEAWTIEGYVMQFREGESDLIMPRTVVNIGYVRVGKRGTHLSIPTLTYAFQDSHAIAAIKITTYSDESVETEVIRREEAE